MTLAWQRRQWHGLDETRQKKFKREQQQGYQWQQQQQRQYAQQQEQLEVGPEQKRTPL